MEDCEVFLRAIGLFVQLLVAGVLFLLGTFNDAVVVVVVVWLVWLVWLVVSCGADLFLFFVFVSLVSLVAC